MAGKTHADFKVIMVGPSGAGKTSIIKRFTQNSFSTAGTKTLGVAFELKEWHDIHLAIWDTAGQEQFARLTSFYARDAAAAVIAYDLTDRESFDHITKWYRYVQDSRRDVKAKGECVVILAACKVDLAETDPSRRQVSAEEGFTKAREIGAIRFLETSSQSGHNIETIFNCLCEELRPGSMTASVSSQPPTPTASSSSLTSPTGGAPVNLGAAAAPARPGCC